MKRPSDIPTLLVMGYWSVVPIMRTLLELRFL